MYKVSVPRVFVEKYQWELTLQLLEVASGDHNCGSLVAPTQLSLHRALRKVAVSFPGPASFPIMMLVMTPAVLLIQKIPFPGIQFIQSWKLTLLNLVLHLLFLQLLCYYHLVVSLLF